MLTSAVAGFSLSIALIVAIGAQNAFVLRQGLRREHLVPVVLTCAVSDALLIGVGIAGVGSVVAARPDLLTAIRWGGAAFLHGYAGLAARRATHEALADVPDILDDVEEQADAILEKLLAVLDAEVS